MRERHRRQKMVCPVASWSHRTDLHHQKESRGRRRSNSKRLGHAQHQSETPLTNLRATCAGRSADSATTGRNARGLILMSDRVTSAPPRFDPTPSTNESHENVPTQKPPNYSEPCVLQRSDLLPSDPYPLAMLGPRRATQQHALSASARVRVLLP